MRFEITFPVRLLRGADYNPRIISDDSIDLLCQSILEVGFAKPVICLDSGLVIAGHQRTKAARKLGMKNVPAFVLREINKSDEIRFNQMHNGTDLDSIGGPVSVGRSTALGFEEVPPAAIVGDPRAAGAVLRSEVATLILRYGEWGCAVANQNGDVLSSGQYAMACRQLGRPCRVFRIKTTDSKIAIAHLRRSYGQFSYEHLQKNTYIQAFAQLFRLRPGARRSRESAIYRTRVLPSLKKSERILDFGCGQADYLKYLRRAGYSAQGIEFFHRCGNSIDKAAVHRMIDETLADVSVHGGFDVVVCDSVLNSVDSLQAESDVMTCLNAFARIGARVYFSGRRREVLEKNMTFTKSAHRRQKRYVEFLDENGFSGLYRNGSWFYQKFHTLDQAKQLGTKFLVDPQTQVYSATDTTFQVCAIKRRELKESDVEGAIRREFELAWPDGTKVGRSELALATLRNCRRAK